MFAGIYKKNITEAEMQWADKPCHS